MHYLDVRYVLVVSVVQTIIRLLHTAGLRPPRDPPRTAGGGNSVCGSCQDGPVALVHLTWITGKIMHARMPAMLCFCTIKPLLALIPIHTAPNYFLSDFINDTTVVVINYA